MYLFFLSIMWCLVTLLNKNYLTLNVSVKNSFKNTEKLLMSVLLQMRMGCLKDLDMLNLRFQRQLNVYAFNILSNLCNWWELLFTGFMMVYILSQSKSYYQQIWRCFNISLWQCTIMSRVWLESFLNIPWKMTWYV